jgi:hypothetical protein
MILKNGYVAVRPFKETEKVGSIYIAPIKESKDYMSIVGEIVGVSDTLPYYGRHAVKIREDYPSADYRPKEAQADLCDYNNRSLNFETNVEVKKGDIVLFDWKQRAFNIDSHEGVILMKYDTLYMSITDNNYKMLNGWLLVEPVKYKQESEVLDLSFSDGEYSTIEAHVRHEGSIVTHYRETPYVEDAAMLLRHKKVLVRKKRMKKVEKEYIGILDNPNYHFIQRRDILGYEP